MVALLRPSSVSELIFGFMMNGGTPRKYGIEEKNSEVTPEA